MKVEAPDDLQGRLIHCEHRATLIAKALEAFAHADISDPDPDALSGLAIIAEELADELRAIEDAYVDESNEQYLKYHPDVAALVEQGRKGRR